MFRFVVGRLLSAIPVLFVVSVVTFLIIWLVPGDVTAEIAGGDATPEEIAAIRQNLGLDRPLLERALAWYGRLLQGDLGHSYLLNRSVAEAVFERLPVTLSLAGLALLISTAIGMLLGILAAVRQNTWLDQGAMVVALVGLSVPDFWFGIVMIILFGVFLGVRACWIGSNRRWGSDSSRILGLDVELLPHGRHGSGRDTFRECLVVDEGNVKHSQTSRSTSGVQVLAARLHLEHLGFSEGVYDAVENVFPRMLVSVFEISVVLDMLAEVIGEGESMQIAADHRLRLVLLRDDDRFKTMFTCRNPAVATDEICVASALHEQL